MSNGRKLKTEHNGAKKGKGSYGHKKEVKKRSKKKRRDDDLVSIPDLDKYEFDRSQYKVLRIGVVRDEKTGRLKLARKEKK